MNIANQEGNVEIFIRGVGTANNTELGDPSAATHINGVGICRGLAASVRCSSTSSVSSESTAALADATFSLSDSFRLKGGVRYTDEEKSRFGIGGNWQVIALGGDGFDCCFGTRFSMPGFAPRFLDRPSFDVSDRSRQALARYLLEGATFGARDTLNTQITGVVDGSLPNGTCVDRPDVDPPA